MHGANVTSVKSAAPAPTSASPYSSTARLVWADNLRTFTILLVVNMHACVTYSHVGDWYIKLPPEPGFGAKIPFILWQGHMQAFFMGLLFFISGFFAWGSLQRKGRRAFLGERMVRLGLPSLFYMLLIHPLTNILLLRRPATANSAELLAAYKEYLATGRVLSGSGPLWFALALLLFCVVLAALGPRPRSDFPPQRRPKGQTILLGIVAVMVSTFLVRLFQPMGRSFFNFQLSFFSQYIAWFLVGVAAARGNWLVTLASSTMARRAGAIALFGGPLLLLLILLFGGEPAGEPNQYEGGWHWQAFGLVAWEQLAGTGLALGLLYLFSRKGNLENTLTRWAAERSFAVYVLHTPVLVALALLFRPLQLDPFVGAIALAFSGIFLSFLAADLARRFPGLRRIL